ncbi:universal stress protein [Streptomyces sp. HUAS ZL42]|uniref:universal stress protein n=1 Tax=Streptomyces sp. HUAS ZL42 TaxID=3231715 RepID=UPI00345EE023
MDGSPVAPRALDRAAEDAARRGTALRVVHAVADRDESGPLLASAAARVHERHPDLPVETRAVEGGAVRVPAEESESAVLTVVGTRGFGGASGLPAGSVSRRPAAHVHGPLLVVRGDNPRDEGREVLLGLESDADAAAAAHAFREAARRGARLRVVHCAAHRHVTPEPPPLPATTSPGQQRQSQSDRAEEDMPRFRPARLREEYPDVEVDSRTVHTARRTSCRRAPARPASWSSARARSRAGSLHRWAHDLRKPTGPARGTDGGHRVRRQALPAVVPGGEHQKRRRSRAQRGRDRP